MSFKYKPTCGLLFTIFFLASLVQLFAQEGTDHLKINLERTRQAELKVSYFPAEQNQGQALTFPRFTQNAYFPIASGKFIKKIKAFDTEHKRIRVKKNGADYIPAEKAAYWEYIIDRKKFAHTVPLAAQLHFKRRKYSFFNPGLFYPVAKGNSLKHKISVRDHISDSTAIVHSFNFGNRRSLNAFAFGASRESGLTSDSSGSFRILFHGSFRDIEQSDFSNIIQSLTSAFHNTTGIKLPEGFQFHIIESDIKTPHESSLPHSACFSNGISIVLNMSSNIFEQKETLIRQCMWQLFRWISPVSSHDGNYDLLHPTNGNHSFHLWYFESVTEYLSLICLVKNRLIDERYFTKIIQGKVSKSIEEPDYSLIQLGTEFNSQTGWLEIRNNLKAYDVFTNRGVVTAMILDIILLQESEGQSGLMRKFLDIHSKHKNQPFSSARFIGEFVDGHSKDLRLVIEKFILGIDAIDYLHYFSMIDWQFFRKGEVHKTFIKGGYFTFFPEINKYVCTKSGKNSVGLQKGDVILSLNNDGQISTYDLNEIIMPSRNIRNENRVKLEIMRNGKMMVLRGKAEFDAKVKDDIIIPLFNPSSNGYQLRKALMH